MTRRSFNEVVGGDVRLEKLASGFVFTEGPVWHSDERCLYFSDIPASITRRWKPDGTVDIVASPNGKSNGMALDHDGKLLICRHVERRVVKRVSDDRYQAVADRFEGKRFNSPNDIVVKSDGSLYFTDPPYGLTKEFGQQGEQEIPYQGVFRMDAARKNLTLLTDAFFRPNGLAFSPDESLLYVNDSEREYVKVFDVEEDGGLSGERLFAEVHGDAPGCPDGMKVDSAGNVWVTGPGGIWVFGEDGTKLGVIAVPEVAANLAFGEADRRTLFVTASSSLYRMRVNIPGK
ncbi:MAG: SMP-30/gluconolactonase/LRE family protein [Candidatus Sumerlaeota bacterium]|nr:SMP-30/gluconolactonase/LRE family protein [Candidatus Sumerlaeota bacterium]